MIRVEKTVFISYRREDIAWASMIYQNLTQHGFDVFFDFEGISAGAFARVILENIRSRAHFLVLLTPTALDRCHEPGDWLRREIETALESRRNVVPIMLDGFDFRSPHIAAQLTGSIAALKNYNGLTVPPAYISEALGRLRDKFLAVPLEAVLHPASPEAVQAAREQQAAANVGLTVEPHAGEVGVTETQDRPSVEAAKSHSEGARPPEPGGDPVGTGRSGAGNSNTQDAGPGPRYWHDWRWLASAAAIVLAITWWASRSPDDPPTTPDVATQEQPPKPVMPAKGGSPTEAKPETIAAPAATKPFAERIGEVFRDCTDCPEMVIVPAGKFTMGSPESESGRNNDEGPQRTVTISMPIAVGRHEVTRGQFARFVRETNRAMDGGCFAWDSKKRVMVNQSDKSWRDPGFTQGDDHPVVCVSWEDTRAYAEWLKGKTGKSYRLLSEAEWEYAARGATTSARFWGEAFDPHGCDFANIADQSAKEVFVIQGWTYAGCRDGFVYTAPVGSPRKPNPFGLYDVLGNVFEWTEDCWNDTYKGAPADARAWTTGNCDRRVVRGGGWVSFPLVARTADRFWNGTTARSGFVGFRLARTE